MAGGMHACNGVPAGFLALQKFRRAYLRLEMTGENNA
jgi:hypothetical protein